MKLFFVKILNIFSSFVIICQISSWMVLPCDHSKVRPVNYAFLQKVYQVSALYSKNHMKELEKV